MTHSTEFKRAVYDAIVKTYNDEECAPFEVAVADEEFDKLCSVCAEACAGSHAELLAIHNIGMCIAECPPITPDDTHTVRMVKEMAYRLNAKGE